jgi:hypothetical protein
MPVDHARKHAQLNAVLDGEEVLDVTSDKGDVSKIKVDHLHKKVFVAGGPEEDSAWKDTNSSYDALMAKIGRTDKGEVRHVESGVQAVEPIEPVAVFPVPAVEEFPGLSAVE